jgi:hypothetical protein
MFVSAQFVIVSVVPFNFTVLLPCDAANFAPLRVTEVPTTPEVALRLVIVGGGNPVNVTVLLFTLFTLTIASPVVAPLGITTVIDVVPHTG